jgi:plastocyanin
MRAVALAVTVAVASVALGACGTGKSSSARHPNRGSAAPATTAPAIKDFKFAPARISVRRGAKVTWTNRDSAEHTATADTGPAFDSGTIQPRKSRTVVLSKPGTYAYHCVFHPFMHGAIIVR